MPVATDPTNFPQTVHGRTFHDLAQEVASYVGGETSGDGVTRAMESIQAAVRRYNVWAWKCTRTTQDITLVAQAAPHTYDLEATFRSPDRALLIDSAGLPQDSVEWLLYDEWRARYPWDQAQGGPQPEFYTMENSHLTGKVTFQPWPKGTLTYPTVRLTYNAYITPPSSPTTVLNVPLHLEHGIAEMAVAIHTHKTSGWNAATGPMNSAEAMMVQLANDPIHGRDFGEIEA